MLTSKVSVGDSGETPKGPGPGPGLEAPVGPQSIVVAVRVLLLLLAAGAVMVAVAMGIDRPSTANSRDRYVCPMHPDVRAAKAGSCPICGMALEPTGGDPAAGSMTRREMQGMADITAVENVRKHRIIDFVRTRSLLFDSRDLRGPAWVDSDGVVTAVFYNDQIQALLADEPGSFFLTRTPKITFAVRRTADPVVSWDRSTSRIRFKIDAGRAGKAAVPLQPGQVGWMELGRRTRDVLAVPAAAIVQSPEGPYVLEPVGDGFHKRPIEIGETFLKQGFAVVLSGLGVHDRVVSKATFFLDADRRLGSRAGEGGWGAP